MIGSLTALVSLALLTAPLAAPAAALDGIGTGEHRSARNGDRDQYRPRSRPSTPGAQNRETYLGIGDSDRMTLELRKSQGEGT